MKEKKGLDVLCKIYAAPFNAVLKMLPKEKRDMLRGRLLKQLYAGDEYCQLTVWPKSVEGLVVKGTKKDFSQTVILLQGPIITQDNFTVNTVKMYLQYYSGVKVVVSTWQDAPERQVACLKELGAAVLLNSYPPFASEGNLNYQLVSTAAGIVEARRLGAAYVFKTRSDQRYYHPCALSLLEGVWEPGKLVMLGGVYNAYSARAFHLSDFMAFGTPEDVGQFYAGTLEEQPAVQQRQANKQEPRFQEYIGWVRKAEADCRVQVPDSFQNAAEHYACPEVVLGYRYFQARGGTLQGRDAIAAYEEFLRRCIRFVDADTLGFYWLKYTYQSFRQNWFQRAGKLDTAKWFALFEQEEAGGGERS